MTIRSGLHGVLDGESLAQELRVPRQPDGVAGGRDRRDAGREPVGGPDRHRRLAHDEGGPVQQRRQGLDRGIDVCQVRGVRARPLRRPDAHEVHVPERRGLVVRRREPQPARAQRSSQHLLEPRLVERRCTGGEGGDLVGVGVDAEHLEPEVGHAGGMHGAQVPGADDRQSQGHAASAPSSAPLRRPAPRPPGRRAPRQASRFPRSGRSTGPLALPSPHAARHRCACPQTPVVGSWFGLNAAVAWIAVVVCFAVTVWVPPDPRTVPTLLGYDMTQSTLSAVIDSASYFTVLSNVVVAVVMTLFWRQPGWTGRWAGALRLDALVMITVTGLVYAIVLAPISTATGWNYFSTVLLHYVVPPLTVLVWLVAGPRRLMRFDQIGLMMVIPVVWLAYTLVRGQVIGAYPYPFVDVAAKGWATVTINIIGIVVGALVLAAAFIGVDRVLSRGPQRAPEPAVDAAG